MVAASAQISVRLTTANREGIARAMLANRFAKEMERLLDDRAALARAVYEDVYKSKDRKFIESAPKGWLPEGNFLKVRFGAEHFDLNFDGSHWRGTPRRLGIDREAVTWRVAAKHLHNVAAVYDANHKLAQRHAAIEERRVDLEARLTTAERQLTAALASASSTGRLKEIWPEAAPFCKEIEKAAPLLPALPTRQLNELLGLPTKVAA